MKNKKTIHQAPTPSEPQENIEFPSELWLHVFSFLDPKSLLGRVQLTSNLFYQLANDANVSWKKLFQQFFFDELPAPIPPRFDWQAAFKTLFLERYGSLSLQKQKYIFLIATGAIEEIRAVKIPIAMEDLQTDQLILIKTAAQFNQSAILDHFYAKAVEQLMIHNAKDHLYWASLCNQRAIVAALLEGEPGLINEAIFEKNKTVTMLAALAGHLELMKELLTIEENTLLEQGFTELYHCVVRSGLLYMVQGFNSFVKEHTELAFSPTSINSLKEDPQTELSLRIRTASTNLPTTISLAVSNGAIAIFKVELNFLYQKYIQLQERSAIEPQQLSTEAGEAKLVFSWAIRTALLTASEHGHVNIIKYVLEKKFYDIDQPLISQQTLLYRAAVYNHLELVKFLLKNQADPEFTLTMLLIDIIDLEGIDYSAVIALLVEAIEQRNRFSNPVLVDAVITSNRADILDRLLAINPEMIVKAKEQHLQTNRDQECNITGQAYEEEEEEKQQRNEKQSNTGKRLSTKRKYSEQEGQEKQATTRKSPRLEPSIGRYYLFNQDIAAAAADSNAEEQQIQTTAAPAPRGPIQFFATFQSTSPGLETEYPDFTP